MPKHKQETPDLNKDKKQARSANSKSRYSNINNRQLDSSYKRTMKQTQNSLPPISRLFSRFIHNEVVEKISNFISSTIARPNAILFGSIFAFVVTLVTYLVAKSMGYTLSGFESIGAFITGWILGNVFDYFRLGITGKK